MHRNLALEILSSTSESDYDEKSKVISNLLCKSVGIFDCIRDELSKWTPKPDRPFPELFDETYITLSKYVLNV